jgi:pyruvate/2-oxoglutarate dehydrogenase complex dihydrolipoamide acyltransferase (E2) component
MSELDIGRYSKVSRRIWSDARFKRLSPPPPSGQFLFLRLLTAPELGTIPGVICAGEAGLAEALGWPIEGFRKAFAEAFREGLVKADWSARLVLLPKALRHNKPESPNVVRSWKNTWIELPECPLKDEAWRTLRAFTEGFGEPFAKAFGEACPKPSPNQEQEQEQEQEKEKEQAGAGAAAAPPPASAVGPLALSGEPSKTAKSSRKRASAVGRTKMRVEWSPKPEHAKYVRLSGLDLDGIVEEFRNTWIDRGELSADWNARFKNNVDRILRTDWLRDRWSVPDSPDTETPPPPQPALPLAPARTEAETEQMRVKMAGLRVAIAGKFLG